MKNYDILGWISIVVFMSIFTHNFCMEVVPTLENYAESCRKINEIHDQAFKLFTDSVTYDNMQEITLSMKSKLQEHMDVVNKNREEVFSGIRKKYDINDETWNKYHCWSTQFQKYREEHLSHACANVIHDERVPIWFACRLKKELGDIGLNPEQVNICHHDNKSVKVQQIEIGWNADTNKSILNFVAPGTIFVNGNSLISALPDVEKGRCIFLASLMKSFEIPNMYNILKIFKLTISEEDAQLLVNCSLLQSLFLSALKKPSKARYIKAYCNRFYAPLYSVEHYQQLSSIELCWRALDWLRKYSDSCNALIIFLKSGSKDDVAQLKSLIGNKIIS